MSMPPIDVSGSSTQALNMSTGGNAGITFAPKGMSTTTVLMLAAGALAALWLYQRGRR